jgi:hypothetical protein
MEISLEYRKLTTAELFINLYAYWPCYVKSIFYKKSAIYTLEIYLLAGNGWGRLKTSGGARGGLRIGGKGREWACPTLS